MAILSFEALAAAIVARTAGFDTDYHQTIHASNFSDKEIKILSDLYNKTVVDTWVDLTLTGDLAVGGDAAVTGDIAAVGGAFSGDVTVDGELQGGTIFGSHLRTNTEITGDGAASAAASGVTVLTKGSAAAITIAAPSAAGIERTIVSYSDFAHVVTFTGGTLHDGTTGGHTTATFAAFKGASVTVVSHDSLWFTKSVVGVTIT